MRSGFIAVSFTLHGEGSKRKTEAFTLPLSGIGAAVVFRYWFGSIVVDGGGFT